MMISFVRIAREGSFLPQFFLQVGGKHCNALSFNNDQVVKEGVPSVVAMLREKSMVLKLVKPRSWHERVKLLWNRSRITKEIRGNFLLRNIGLKTPEIIEYGLGVIPAVPYQFLGYFVMQDLHEEGFEDVFDRIRFNRIEHSARSSMINNFYNDLLTMQSHYILFSDLKFNNVFCDQDGNVAWIDTGVTSYGLLGKNKYKKKFNHSLNRFLRMYNQHLMDDERELIKQLLF